MHLRHWYIHAYIERWNKAADLDTAEKRLRALADRIDAAKTAERQRTFFEEQAVQHKVAKRRAS